MVQSPDYMKLLPPEVLARFANGKVLARGFVQGSKTGDHRSPYIGTSTEFAEHREYSPGDEPRNLDWRVYGKTDRYYVKQFVEETNLRATILLDTSASMNFGGSPKKEETNSTRCKFLCARHLAATVGYLLSRQGDAVGLASFDTKIRHQLPPRSTATHFRLLLQTLWKTKPGGESKLADVLHEVADRIPRRGLVIVISDFLDEVPDIVRAFHHLRHYKHELLIFHVMAEEELNFPYTDVTRFRNLELYANQIDVDPKAIRREYLNQVQTYLQELKSGCGQVEADYVRFNTRVPYYERLAEFLAARMSRAGGVG